MNFTVDIELETKRCPTCGRWYAYEKYRSSDCPMCTVLLLRERDQAIVNRDRTIAALKGALTKARGKP